MNRLITTLIFSLTLTASYSAPPRGNDLTAANYREWIEYIRPTDSENTWQKISWRNKFMPAVTEATELDRPILLWAMNGNPCGET